jgi:hypothetical protein
MCAVNGFSLRKCKLKKNNNNTLFNEDLQIKLQLVQLVSNLVLLSSRNILHHMITILMQLTYFSIKYRMEV